MTDNPIDGRWKKRKKDEKLLMVELLKWSVKAKPILDESQRAERKSKSWLAVCINTLS